MDRILEVKVTCGNLREAKSISEALLKEKLIACSNISETYSLYNWKGQPERHSEFIMNLKTTKAIYPKLEKRIKELHSYEAPAILAIPIETASEEYKNWVFGNVKG